MSTGPLDTGGITRSDVAAGRTLKLLAMAAVGCGLVSLIVGTLLGGQLGDDQGLLLGLGMVVGVACIALAIAAPKVPPLLWLVGAMTFYEFFDAFHVPLGFMRLYVQDVVFAYLLGLVLWRWSIGRYNRWNFALNRYVWIFFAVGLWGVVNGLFITGNEYDEVLGDFRRSYFYFMNYFLILQLVDGESDRKKLQAGLLVGSGLLVAKGFFQLTTGQFYYRSPGDAAHILSYIELVFVTFGVFYAAAQVLYGPKASRLVWAGVAAVGMFIVLVGNYRASWLGLIGGLFFIFCFLPGRRKVQAAALAVAFAVFVALAVAMLWDVEVLDQSTLGAELTQKANVTAAPQDVNIIWRLESYKAALNQWLMAPMLGSGLGTYLEFYVPTASGNSMLVQGHNVHNSLLWMMMTTGLLGLLAVLAMHARFLMIIAKYLKSAAPPAGRSTALACGAFYVSMMIATIFQNFLEGAIPVTVFGAVAALAMTTTALQRTDAS